MHVTSSNVSALPPKLLKKLLDLEYIDMSELVPDSWRIQGETEGDKCCLQSKRPKRGPVTDILLWSECYATLVSVLGERFPNKIPGFMSYMKTIIKASRSFQGDAWVSYDMTFRRQAANRKSLDWGIIDPMLYNETFAGRARQLNRCKFCISEHHSSSECVYAPDKEESRASPFRQFRSNGSDSSKPMIPTLYVIQCKGRKPVQVQAVQICTPLFKVPWQSCSFRVYQ